MERSVVHMVVLTEEEWRQFKTNQNEILLHLRDLKTNFKPSRSTNLSEYITAKDFLKL
jgi:hypothetical protein